MEIGRAAYVALVGRPNVGKSTLMNRLVGQKVAIVSPKPQTTRGRVMGVMNEEDAQIVFLDTPGVHRPKNKLGDAMLKSVGGAIFDVDLSVLVVEPVAAPGEPELELIQKLESSGCPALLVINKIDEVKKEKLLAVISAYMERFPFEAVLPVSARTGEGVDALKAELLARAEEGPAFFPPEQYTDQSEREMVAEIIREKALLLLDQEIPHGIAVDILTFERKREAFVINADLYCEKASHKGIIIGRGGAMLKELSSRARREMEQLLGAKVYLKIWVKVRESWRDSDFQLGTLGFTKEN